MDAETPAYGIVEKLEIRSTKHETNPKSKFPNLKEGVAGTPSAVLDHLNFDNLGIVSDFDIRSSNSSP